MSLGQIKKNVFRVTRPYLNLLVKPRFFFGFLEKKYIILCILKGEMPEMPFKMLKIIYIFSRKKNNIFFFNWPYHEKWMQMKAQTKTETS